MKRRLTIATILAVLLGLLGTGIARHFTGNAQAVTYLFNDEFSGVGVPDTTKWYRSNVCPTRTDLLDCWKANNAYMDGNGHLILRLTTGTMGRTYDGARIQTLSGEWPPSPPLKTVSPPVRVEESIKFTWPHSPGMWEAAVMYRSDQASSNQLELDTQEYRGAHWTEQSCNTHNVTPPFSGVLDTGLDLGTGYHNYWANYYSDHVVFGVDGLACGTTTISAAPSEYMVFQFDVGSPGTWGGDGGPPPAGNIPAYMFVDYIRATRL